MTISGSSTRDRTRNFHFSKKRIYLTTEAVSIPFKGTSTSPRLLQSLGFEAGIEYTKGGSFTVTALRCLGREISNGFDPEAQIIFSSLRVK